MNFRHILQYCASAVAILIPLTVLAHQQPTTIASLDVMPERVTMQLEIPLTELELAFGHDVTVDPETNFEVWRGDLADYLIDHIKPVSPAGDPWTVEAVGVRLSDSEQSQSGPFREVIATLILNPPPGSKTRHFTLEYDVVMHQVVTHIAIVSVRNDWETGVTKQSPVEVGAIRVDTGTTKIFPLEINLENGTTWTGFRSMVSLGMEHIREGTDHLLFLLVLLLPATLLVNRKRWGGYGGARYGISRLLKIVTAFTVGHSVTLAIGALGWFALPQQPVEILIAFSILISAVHAARPIFPGNEVFVAGGFGLVHGLAFAAVLGELSLTPGQLALSLLGFNLGIEIMQLIVIALVVPWLVLLSQTRVYTSFRLLGSALAGIAAAAWIFERVSGNPNVVANLVKNTADYAYVGIAALALVAVVARTFFSRQDQAPVA